MKIFKTKLFDKYIFILVKLYGRFFWPTSYDKDEFDKYNERLFEKKYFIIDQQIA